MKHKFFFPLNYDYSSKLLGIIEYKLLTPLCIYGTVIFFILKNIEISFFMKSGIFVVLFLPAVLILNSRVHTEPFYTFLFSIIKHYLNCKIYLFKRVIWCGINLNCNFSLLLKLFGLEF